MKEVVIAGGTGAIGQKLCKVLIDSGYKVIVLSRKLKTYQKDGVYYQPYPITSIEIGEFFEGKFALINLAGHLVADGRWNVKTKDLIYYSRKDTTHDLVEGINICKNPPNLFISTSAIGYYGDRGIEELDEYSSKGLGFLSDVCMVWEDEAKKSKIKTAIIRVGVVLDKNSGALSKMLLPFKFFVGGPIGNGKQILSWIDIEDLVNAYKFVLDNSLDGIYNATAPNPVDMNSFAKTLAKVMKRPNLFRVPSFVLKVLMGESSVIVLGGQKVIPEELSKAGFKFKYNNLEESLKSQLK